MCDDLFDYDQLEWAVLMGLADEIAEDESERIRLEKDLQDFDPE